MKAPNPGSESATLVSSRLLRLVSLLSIPWFYVPQVDVRRQHGLAAADPEVRHDARLQEHNPRGAAGPDLGRGTLWSGMHLFIISTVSTFLVNRKKEFVSSVGNQTCK